jgi:hypothetical protein
MPFAEGTDVPVTKSRIELEELLRKWKADRIGSVTEPGAAIVGFSMGKWHVRFRMPLPTENDARNLKDRRYTWRSATDAEKKAWLEQKHRERWRALLLTVKAKLVSVENGVESFEEAFLAHLVLPGGVTVGQKALPAISEAYETGKMTSGNLLGDGR